MGSAGTVALVVVLLLVLAAVAYAAATRSSLVRMRDLAVEAGALAEQRRSRLSELSQHAGQEPDEQTRRAVADAEHRLAGDLAFHGAAVRAYDERLARVPASWVGALTGLHPLGAAAERGR
ncbi:hypothetical protein [Kineococcus indalonis]|uniref:hypothetical protein n=1 Tax=Kineococcus indalonis TaxID=2696566 RepID=UPI001412A021|nr:hypothetical protein [Kineococcus indalonis]NAZ85963.1 hypothetical protein [Kineococcus indalonis]